MYLGQLLKSVSKKYQKINVQGISFDSRKVKKKDIFFAIQGNQTSGIKFINEAIFKGASAIICDKKIRYKDCPIPIIIVKNIRRSLSEACSGLYRKKPKNMSSHLIVLIRFYYYLIALINLLLEQAKQL